LGLGDAKRSLVLMTTSTAPVAPAATTRDSSGQSLGAIRIGFAVVWMAGILALGTLSRLDTDLHACRTTTASTGSSTGTERVTGAPGAATRKSSTASGSTVTTRTCEPIGLPELAFASFPAMVALLPAIKGFNLGVFGVDLREVERQVAEQTKEQIFRVIHEHRAVSGIALGLEQANSGDVEPAPRA
jgi:hypothetical protein